MYIRGPIKGYIKPYYIHYPTVTGWGQYPKLRHFRLEGLGLTLGGEGRTWEL